MDQTEHRLSHISSKRPQRSFFPAVHRDTHTYCAHIRGLGPFGSVWVCLSRAVWVFRAAGALMRAHNEDILLGRQGAEDFQIRKVGYACLKLPSISFALLLEVGVLLFGF